MYAFEVAPEELQDRLFVPLFRAKHVIADLELKKAVSVTTLGTATDVASGTYISRYVPKGWLYLRVDNVREFLCNLNPEDIEFVRPDADGITDRVILKRGDVLISRTGTLGKAAVCCGPVEKAVLSQHLTRLTVKDDQELKPGYLAAFLNCDLGKYQLILSGYGSTRQELTHSALRDVKVPLVSERLQKRVDGLVWSGLSDMYQSVGEYEKAVGEMEAVLGVPDLNGKRDFTFAVASAAFGFLWTPRFYKPSYVGLVKWLEANYECKPLGKLAHIERGKGTRVSDYATHGIPFVRTTSLINFGIDPFPDHYASEDIQELFEQPVGEGDILFSMEGKIGHAAYLTNEDVCVFKNHIELVRCQAGVDPMAVYLVLAGIIGKAQADKNTVIQATLPGMASRLRDILIPLKPSDPSRVRTFSKQTQQAVERGLCAAKIRAESVRKLREASDLVDNELERLAREDAVTRRYRQA